MPGVAFSGRGVAGAVSTGRDGQCETLGIAFDDSEFLALEGWHVSGEGHFTAHTWLRAQPALDDDADERGCFEYAVE